MLDVDKVVAPWVTLFFWLPTGVITVLCLMILPTDLEQLLAVDVLPLSDLEWLLDLSARAGGSVCWQRLLLKLLVSSLIHLMKTCQHSTRWCCCSGTVYFLLTHWLSRD
jgi:hypothetical protein